MWDNIFSRTVWFFLQPSNLMFIWLAVGVFLVWKGRRKAGLWTLSTLMGLYVLIMIGPLTDALMVPLERRFSVYSNQVNAGPYAGIIVLAGSENKHISRHHDQVILTEASERLIEAAKLARMFPSLPLIYSGGPRGEGLSTQLEIARKFFREAGIDLKRIRFEDQSYNTYTNALESKQLIQPQETGPWLLVTSAFHMPRAVGAFRKAKVAIQPYPVDYRTTLSVRLLNNPNAGRRLARLDYAVHEWVGLLAYYLTGRIEDLFPEDR